MGWGVKNEGNDFWWRRSVLKGKKKGKKERKRKRWEEREGEIYGISQGLFFLLLSFQISMRKVG